MSSKKVTSAATHKHKAGAEKLAALRVQMGWSPEALGAQAGVSGKWIREIERSNREPTERVKARLARPFDMLPWDIWRPVGHSPLSAQEIERLRELTHA